MWNAKLFAFRGHQKKNLQFSRLIAKKIRNWKSDITAQYRRLLLIFLKPRFQIFFKVSLFYDLIF